jgi:hypothetical protein
VRPAPTEAERKGRCEDCQTRRRRRRTGARTARRHARGERGAPALSRSRQCSLQPKRSVNQRANLVICGCFEPQSHLVGLPVWPVGKRSVNQRADLLICGCVDSLTHFDCFHHCGVQPKRCVNHTAISFNKRAHKKDGHAHGHLTPHTHTPQTTHTTPHTPHTQHTTPHFQPAAKMAACTSPSVATCRTARNRTVYELGNGGTLDAVSNTSHRTHKVGRKHTASLATLRTGHLLQHAAARHRTVNELGN